MRATRKNQKGLTLIELLVVVAIIGVIIGSGMPKFDPRRQDINTALASLLGDFRYTRARAITTGKSRPAASQLGAHTPTRPCACLGRH